MQFKYELVGMTKRYAKFNPAPVHDGSVTGAFYLCLTDWAALGKPEVLVLEARVA